MLLFSKHQIWIRTNFQKQNQNQNCVLFPKHETWNWIPSFICAEPELKLTQYHLLFQNWNHRVSIDRINTNIKNGIKQPEIIRVVLEIYEHGCQKAKNWFLIYNNSSQHSKKRFWHNLLIISWNPLVVLRVFKKNQHWRFFWFWFSFFKMGIRNSLIPKIWKNQNMKLLKYNNQMTAQHQFFVFQGVIVCFSDSVYWNHKKNRHEYIEALRKKGHNNKERGSKLWWQLHQSSAFVYVFVLYVYLYFQFAMSIPQA